MMVKFFEKLSKLFFVSSIIYFLFIFANYLFIFNAGIKNYSVPDSQINIFIFLVAAHVACLLAKNSLQVSKKH